MRPKPVIYNLIILLSACQKQTPPTERTPIVEPSILGLAALDIGSVPSDQIRPLLRQALARRRVLSANGQLPLVHVYADLIETDRQPCTQAGQPPRSSPAGKCTCNYGAASHGG